MIRQRFLKSTDRLQVDEHEVPGTLAEAITSIKKQGSEIMDAFKAGQPDDVHHQLHQIGHLIEALPELGKQAALSEAEIKRVEEATEKLTNAFGALDESLHGKQTKSLDDVELEVQWAMNLLEPMLSK